MVDVTFIFMLLLGGPLVGLVTAGVRGHRGWRKITDILGGLLFGIFGHALWIKFVQAYINYGPEAPQISGEWAYFLTYIVWFSPVIGACVGMLLIAILWRLAGLPLSQPHDNAGQKLGAAIRIVGWVYAVIALSLTVGVVALAYSLGTTEALSGMMSWNVVRDLLLGPALIGIGWVVAWLFTPGIVPAPNK